MTIAATRLLETRLLSNQQRYQLLTTVVVPRPIGWVSSYSGAGVRNLAPFSYFAALSATPMYIGVSVGHRRTGPKDTLANVRTTRAFCVNVVTERQLEVMNATSADYPPEVDEFVVAGLTPADADHVYAPYVADCPAVLECMLLKEVELEGATNCVGQEIELAIKEPLANDCRCHDPNIARAKGRGGREKLDESRGVFPELPLQLTSHPARLQAQS